MALLEVENMATHSRFSALYDELTHSIPIVAERGQARSNYAHSTPFTLDNAKSFTTAAKIQNISPRILFRPPGSRKEPATARPPSSVMASPSEGDQRLSRSTSQNYPLPSHEKMKCDAFHVIQPTEAGESASLVWVARRQVCYSMLIYLFHS